MRLLWEKVKNAGGKKNIPAVTAKRSRGPTGWRTQGTEVSYHRCYIVTAVNTV